MQTHTHAVFSLFFEAPLWTPQSSELPANTGPPDGTKETEARKWKTKRRSLAFLLIFLKTLLSKHC